MEMTQEEYWFWLNNIPNIFRESIHKLLEVFESPERLFAVSEKELRTEGLLSEEHMQAFLQSRKSLACLHTLEQIRKDGVRFLYPAAADFPEKLRQIPDMPYGLYVKGQLPDASLPSVSMVGARVCTEYGKSISLRFSKTLAAAGVQMVSGMAVGIDSMCAKGALQAGGKTFAVLGSGLDVIYPTENFYLYYDILASGGGIISEYPMGTPPLGWQFPLRNRIISGLGDLLLVMEAKEKSGTMVTVQYALAQGKDVYALPGRITDATSKGCNQMIADGAGILTTPEQLLELIFQQPMQKEGFLANERSKSLRSDLQILYRYFETEPLSLQFLTQQTGLLPAKISAQVAELELLGFVREVSKNNYVKIF